MQLRIDTIFRLHNGVEMPCLGIGLYRSPSGKLTQDSILEALRTGYRHIDTARLYKNEKDTGAAIQQSGVSREQIFVTTKLWNEDQGYDSTFRAFEQSLKDLRLQYIDQYIIHWPVTKKRRDSWRALEKIYEGGSCRSIGVSNYTIRHLKEMDDYAAFQPHVNQVEFHPFLYQQELLQYCRTRKIQLVAYSPLTKGQRLNHPAITSVAKKYGKTPAQILIRWVLQHETVAIPKSNRPERIRENGDVFDFNISDADMNALNSLDEGFHTSWDPTNVR